MSPSFIAGGAVARRSGRNGNRVESRAEPLRKDHKAEGALRPVVV